MNINRKGFTLVELLVIILLLAVVALISTPIVLNIIEKSGKGAFMKSAQGLLRTTNLYYIENKTGIKFLGNIEFKCENMDDDKCTSQNKDAKDLKHDGILGIGKATIDPEGRVSFDITNNKYCAYKYAIKDDIYIVKGTCEENNIDIVHDTVNPTIVKTGETITPYSITINYETTDDKGIKEVICNYSDNINDLNKKGIADESKCLMDNLQSSHNYYYKICAIDKGLNESNPCITGEAKTKAAIAGTPTILASWPNTTSIKVDVSGMTIDESDTVSYRYSINGVVKQDWTTDSSYTYIGLKQGTSNNVLIETKATDSGDLGNTKEAIIYTSKTVTETNNGYETTSACNSSTKIVEATDIYSSITLKNPTCSSYTSITSKACSTSYTTSGSCTSSRTCSANGGSGTVQFDYEHESCEEGVKCSSKVSTSEITCGSGGSSTRHVCYDDWYYDGLYSGLECACWAVCGEDGSCGRGCAPKYCQCIDNSTCTKKCYYSGSIDVSTTYYKASYSGVLEPSQKMY